MASGEMTPQEFANFLRESVPAARQVQFRRFNSFHLHGLSSSTGDPVRGRAAYTELKNLIVWVKDNGGMGTFYRSRHELVFAFKSGTAPHINNFELGQHGRYRTNVWEYRGVNSFGADRMSQLALHPTTKPVRMLVDAIKDVTSRNGIVLDVFGGSGSTLIAAHKAGRRARLAELDPLYVDQIVRRWQAYADDDAILTTTGETFDQVARRRHLEQAGNGGNMPNPARKTNAKRDRSGAA